MDDPISRVLVLPSILAHWPLLLGRRGVEILGNVSAGWPILSHGGFDIVSRYLHSVGSRMRNAQILQMALGWRWRKRKSGG